MKRIKKVIAEQVEEKIVEMIVEQVHNNGLTILNVKEMTDKVIKYMEENAVLKVEDSI